MWVESRTGAGSTFFFTMQLGRSARGNPAPVPPPSLSGMRVLVVDDHPTSRGLLARSVTDLGMEYCEANSGAAALDILNSGGEPFSFVIADHHMPEMAGARFLQIASDQGRLRSSREWTGSLLLCSGPPPVDGCCASRNWPTPWQACWRTGTGAGVLRPVFRILRQRNRGRRCASWSPKTMSSAGN